MKLLDLFCGSGEFKSITGIDNETIFNYPYKFIRFNALDYLWEEDLRSFDLIHASNKKQLNQAIPPKYTEYIGKQFLKQYQGD